MARLNVQAAARWVGPPLVDGGVPSYARTEMLLALSVTNEDGAGVDPEELEANQIRVGYQFLPEASEAVTAEISDFHHNGPTFGGTGWYSCRVQPPSPRGWGQGDVFLCVTVRRGQDRGQALLLARYQALQ